MTVGENSLWILLVRDASSHTTGFYLERALTKEHNVISIPINPWYLSEPKTCYPKKVRKILSKGYDRKMKSKYPDPDLILVIDPVREKFDFSRFPKAKTAYYAIDSHLKLDKHLEKAEVENYDFLFVAHKDYIPRYQETGCRNVHWLPLGCDEDIHRYHKKLPLLYDLCFLGGISPERREILTRLEKEFKLMVENKYLHDMARVYSKTRIVFNKAIKGDLNMRVFETLSCQRLLLTDRIANGLEELFADKIHLVLYDNYNDLQEKIRFYLKNEEERERIARLGQEEVHQRHTYTHRVKEMLRVMGMI